VKRLSVLVAALVVVALVGGFAAYLSFDDGAAAYTANGQRVAQSDVDRELQALADNATFKKLLRQAQLQPLSTYPGSVQSGFAAGWLSLRIAQTFADGVVSAHHIRVTTADRSNGETLAARVLGSPQVLRTLPTSFRSDVRDRFARVAALTRILLTNPSPRVLNAALQACPSHRFVGHILVTSLADAQAIKAALTAGGDFATLARQHSTDRASAVQGGDVGCLDSRQFVAPFAQAARTLPIGQVSDPVQTQFGFHLIVVSDKPSATEIASIVINRILNATGQRVTLDPRYGTWDRRNGRVVSPAAARPAGPGGSSPTPTPTG
jgi:hypothetical protein